MDDTPEALAHRPAVVIRLSNNMSKDAIKWLVQRISGDKLGNDCQLDVVQSENLLYVRYINVFRVRLFGILISVFSPFFHSPFVETKTFSNIDAGFCLTLSLPLDVRCTSSLFVTLLSTHF